jgi:hypothetical protein
MMLANAVSFCSSVAVPSRFGGQNFADVRNGLIQLCQRNIYYETLKPFCANTRAIPLPIVPAPMTETVCIIG